MKDLIDLAQHIIKDNKLCDHCLGRLFARLSYGLSNRERGKALRVGTALTYDTEYTEPIECEICEDRFNELSAWSQKAYKKVKDIEFNTFHMGCMVPDKIVQKEKELQSRYGLGDSSESLSQEFNREVGKKFEEILGKREREAELDRKNPDIVILMDLRKEKIEVQINPLFIFGRYRKLVRGIPQTKWPCKNCQGKGCPECDFTGKRYPESVEELITPPVLEAFRGSDSSFHGAGREDIDARMLGSGRPFVIEVKKPQIRTLDLEEIEKKVNQFAEGKVEVELTHFVDRDMVRRVKSRKIDKVYRARIDLEKPVDENTFQGALDKLKGGIKQRTPRRVSHRRADKVRKRRVLAISGELMNGQRVVVRVKGESGLYIKELISGDGGRTQPSLAELLGFGCEVSELDVLEVTDDFELP